MVSNTAQTKKNISILWKICKITKKKKKTKKKQTFKRGNDTYISEPIPSPIGTQRTRQTGVPPLAITPRHT